MKIDLKNGLKILMVLCLLWGVPSTAGAADEKAATASDAGEEPAGRSEEKDVGRVYLEPTVVTADRMQVPLEHVTKSISVVTTEERNGKEQYFLPELLDDLPGVYLRRNGGPGQFSNISIRGSGTQHTQFRYNGFPLRDAADTQSTFQYFIGDLYGASNIEQVEVLRGTSSTLYGSQAMGGVVNVIPEKWVDGFGLEWRNEVGDRNTFIQNGRVFYGQADRYYVDINPQVVTTDGENNGGPNDYYYDSLGGTIGAGLRFGPGMSVEFSSITFDSDLALSEVNPALDANGQVVKNLASEDEHREGLMTQQGLSYNHEVSAFWDYCLRGSYGRTERHYFWSDTPGDQSNYDGETTYLEMQHNLRPLDWLTVTAGADYEKSVYDGREPRNPYLGDYTPVYTNEQWESWDAFGQIGVALLDDALRINAGGRYTHHERFDSKTIGEFSAAYAFDTGTRLHGHTGSGYRTPSLYETYGGYLWNGQVVTIGNPDLRPEESRSYELGVDQMFMDGQFTMGLTWFRTDFDDLIIFDGFANRYENASEARAEGFESYVNVRPNKRIGFMAAYTYTSSEYREKGRDFWIRKEYLPRNKASFTTTVVPVEDLTASVRISWSDERIVPLYDPSWNKVRYEEPSVVTVDAALSYTVCKWLEVWLRAENLLDKDYTESGFTMPGRWVYGGTKITF